MLIDGHVAHATAMIVQILKAQHQAAINQGSWDVASLLLPTEDPLARQEFGGDHEEILRIQSHRRAMRDLRVQATRGLGGENAEEDEKGKQPKGKAKAKP